MNLKKKNGTNYSQKQLLSVLIIGFLFPFYQCLAIATDTISPSYQGYRLKITDIEIIKSRKNKRKITCTLINTGRYKVKLPYQNPTIPLVINFDHSLKTSKLTPYQNSLKKAILQSKTSLGRGKIQSNYKLKFVVDASLNTPQSSYLEETNGNNAKAKKQPQKSDTTTDKIVQDDKTTQNHDFLQGNCADLVLDTVFIIKKSKKWVEIAFTISNQGQKAANIWGPTESLDDNVAIRAYASGTAKLSRGDLVLGGAFIEEGMEKKDGILQPGHSFSGSFKVETRKKTRYMPYFILSIDDYQGVWECDETNNVKALLER